MHRYTEPADPVKTQGEDGQYCQVKERDFRRRRLLASMIVRKINSV
jgi:hypothetical protein